MSIFQVPESIQRKEVFRDIRVWASQLFLLCLLGITIAIVRWRETGLWITTLALVVILAIVLLLKILRAVKLLEKKAEEAEKHEARAPNTRGPAPKKRSRNDSRMGNAADS